MKIVGFEANVGLRLGVVEGDQVIDLQAVDQSIPSDLGEVLRAGGERSRGIAQQAGPQRPEVIDVPVLHEADRGASPGVEPAQPHDDGSGTATGAWAGAYAPLIPFAWISSNVAPEA